MNQQQTQPRERLYGVWQPIEREQAHPGDFRYVYDMRRRDYVAVPVEARQ